MVMGLRSERENVPPLDIFQLSLGQRKVAEETLRVGYGGSGENGLRTEEMIVRAEGGHKYRRGVREQIGYPKAEENKVAFQQWRGKVHLDGGFAHGNGSKHNVAAAFHIRWVLDIHI